MCAFVLNGTISHFLLKASGLKLHANIPGSTVCSERRVCEAIPEGQGGGEGLALTVMDVMMCEICRLYIS